EPVSPFPRDSLTARLDDRVAGRGERQLVDHEQGEGLALDVHALPEGGRGEEDRADVVAEALEQPLARRVSLLQDGELQPARTALDQFVESTVGRGEHEGAARGEPAQ